VAYRHQVSAFAAVLVVLIPPLSAVSASVPARTERWTVACKGRKSSLSGHVATGPPRHTLARARRGGTGRSIFAEKGDNMNDYEQVTQDIKEGLSIVAANKGDKSVEMIMKEILEVLITACEQHNIDKLEFIQAFYEWYKEKRN
jgi:hypothetical protein